MAGKAQRISEIAREQKPFLCQKSVKTELISGLRKTVFEPWKRLPGNLLEESFESSQPHG